MEVVVEYPSLFTLYSDGSVRRHLHPTAPASSLFTDGVASKDVIVNPQTGVWARIFMPETASRKVPILLYFHGGGFSFCSPALLEYHNFFQRLCKTARVIVVAVKYRLAPEHRLPAAYEDCTEVVQWLGKHAAGEADVPEEWLSTSVADFSRCFLAGENAGANIAYHVGVRVGDVDMRPLMVKGLIAIHPFFGSEETLESEEGKEMESFVKRCRVIWSIVLPVGSTRDHPFCNPAVLPLRPGLRIPPVLVGVAGGDGHYERGVMFFEHLKRNGKEAEMMVEEDGMHAFHIFCPNFQGTLRLIHRISHFVDKHSI